VVTPEWLEAEFVAEAAPWVAEGERTYFDRLAGGADRDMVLFGAGNLGRRTLAGLRQVGIEPLGFIDNDPSLHWVAVDGLGVLPPAEAADRYRDAVIVTTVWSPNRPLVFEDAAVQLRAVGHQRSVPFVPLHWKWADRFLPYYCLELPHQLYDRAEAIRTAYALFADPISQQEFRRQLSYLLSAMDSVALGSMNAGTYFPSELFTLSAEETFIDCGAYDGDTVRAFLNASRGRFRAVVAFEPDPDAARRLRAAVSGLPDAQASRIRVEELAVGDRSGLAYLEAGGTPGSRISAQGTHAVPCVTLDAGLAEVPTFIKMDIEGAERAALMGAERLIQEHRPVLAVCVYHLQDDLHTLPTLLDRLCDGYSLFLRRQAIDNDLVCFAVPNERLRK